MVEVVPEMTVCTASKVDGLSLRVFKVDIGANLDGDEPLDPKFLVGLALDGMFRREGSGMVAPINLRSEFIVTRGYATLLHVGLTERQSPGPWDEKTSEVYCFGEVYDVTEHVFGPI